MAITNYTFFNWNSTYSYAKWDVIYGASASDTRYFYSTISANVGADPVGQYVYSPLATTRNGNVCRTTFTQTGTIYFQQGSVVVVSGILPDTTTNYTGVVLAAGAGYVDYINPGLDTTNACTNGGVRAPIHPYWTTGFYWIPSFSTDVSHDQSVVVAGMGEGYTQRQNPFINSNALMWNLVFEERTDKEAMSLLNYCENQGGVTPFRLPFPIGLLYPTPTLKYINGNAKHRMSSYGLNSIVLSVTQVFDI